MSRFRCFSPVFISPPIQIHCRPWLRLCPTWILIRGQQNVQIVSRQHILQKLQFLLCRMLIFRGFAEIRPLAEFCSDGRSPDSPRLSPTLPDSPPTLPDSPPTLPDSCCLVFLFRARLPRLSPTLPRLSPTLPDSPRLSPDSPRLFCSAFAFPSRFWCCSQEFCVFGVSCAFSIICTFFAPLAQSADVSFLSSVWMPSDFGFTRWRG